MYRPPDWKKIRLLALNEVTKKMGGGFDEDYFEAGADAYEKGLLSQEHQDWLATEEGESCKGTWVFIPKGE